MKKYFCLLLAALIFVFSGCKTASSSRQFFSMNTVMRLTVYGENGDAAAQLMEEEIYRLNDLLDPSSDGSEVYAINTGSAEVGDEVIQLLEYCFAANAATGGSFDVTVRPLTLAWGFADGNYRVPEENELEALLNCVGSDKAVISGNTVMLPEGSSLDFGGVAKGYAAVKLAQIARQNGVSALLELGGNVQTVGNKPDGSDWRVALANPEGGDYLGVLSFGGDMAVVTSGSYQRCFTEDGKTYHHIIDAGTGRPADNGLVSVTVVCADAERADMLSTALFVMGLEAGMAYCEQQGDFEAIFVTWEYQVALSEGAKAIFELQNDKYVLIGD